MRIDPRRSSVEEKSAAAIAPQSLPTPAGELRYQTMLDTDATYQRLVVGACALAFVAGTGFGRLPRQEGWLHAALWCLTASGLVARCLLARARLEGSRNPILWAPRLAAFGWALSATDSSSNVGWRAVQAASLLGIVVAVDLWSIRRSSVAPAVATVALLHLGAAPLAAASLHSALAFQLVAAAVEFGLITAAGWRQTMAGLKRLPAATYRAAPLCVVPRLDRAWDHPVKINVL